MTHYTGYKATKVINVRLEQEGLKGIPPQMIYTYISKGMIPTEIVEDKKQIKESVLTDWLEGYVQKRIEKANKVKEELTN